jgi:phage shock protein A
MLEQKKTNSQEKNLKQNWLMPILFIVFIGLTIGLISFNFQQNQSGAKKALNYYIQLRNLVDSQSESLINFSKGLKASKESYQALKERIEQTKKGIGEFEKIADQIQVSTDIKGFLINSKELASSYRQALDDVIEFLDATLELEQEYELFKRLEGLKEGMDKVSIELEKIYEGAKLLVDYNLVIAQKETNFLDKSDIQNQAKEQLAKLEMIKEINKVQEAKLSFEEAQKLKEIYEKSRLSFRQITPPRLEPEWLITEKVATQKQSLNAEAFQLVTRYGVDLENLS